jgi:hypothetical protein
MKRAAVLPVLAVMLGLGLWLVLRSHDKSSHADSATETKTTATTLVSVAPSAPPSQPSLLGVTILRDYANTNLPPENDLTLMSRLMDNSLLLLKSAANRPLSANEDWASLLRGQNAARERFLPDHHAALNSQGQLIDRWGAPLFFHALGGGRFELRSAGPDQKLWTDDDIHRNSNGSSRRGRELNPPSLFDESAGAEAGLFDRR